MTEFLFSGLDGLIVEFSSYFREERFEDDAVQKDNENSMNKPFSLENETPLKLFTWATVYCTSWELWVNTLTAFTLDCTREIFPHNKKYHGELNLIKIKGKWVT